MRQNRFTIVEIMVVVMIIGLVAAIAVPSFMNSRRTSHANACINNLRQIEGAKESWAATNNKDTGDSVTNNLVDLVGSNSFMKNTPVCAAGGTYVIGVIGASPVCTKSAEGHVR